jgi:hypothetical protein
MLEVEGGYVIEQGRRDAKPLSSAAASKTVDTVWSVPVDGKASSSTIGEQTVGLAGHRIGDRSRAYTGMFQLPREQMHHHLPAEDAPLRLLPNKTDLGSNGGGDHCPERQPALGDDARVDGCS